MTILSKKKWMEVIGNNLRYKVVSIVACFLNINSIKSNRRLKIDMMNKTDFIIAIRNISRQKFYSFLNLTGLSIGLSLVIFIGLFLYEQFSYDKWYKDYDRIYRVEMGDWAILGPVYSSLISNSSASVENTLRINSSWGYELSVKVENKPTFLKIPYTILTDSVIFDFFPFTFIEGSANNALNSKDKIVLTRSQAINLYGRTDVLGEIIRLQDKYPVTVAGVIEDVKHFHVKVDAIASFLLYGDIMGPEYFDSPGDWNHNTYVKLYPGADVAATERAIEKAVGNYMEEKFGFSSERKGKLRNVADIYFTSEKMHELLVVHGSKSNSYAFLMIAVFILVIAIINFINLATAASASRARETGIRKLLGSSRKKLIRQYLLESVIITMVAVLVAFSLVEMFLPYFNYVTNSENSLRHIGFGKLSAIFVVCTLVIGVLSGSYPAFYLSAFQPASILKGEVTRGSGAAIFRKVLIVFQFTISIALIAATIILYQQINHIRAKETGFNKEGIIHFKLNAKVVQSWESFRNAVASHPAVASVALSNTIPGHVRWQESLNENGASFQYTYWPMTPEYFEMLEMSLVAGRAFSREMPSDEGVSVVVNEKWIHQSGLEFSTYDDLIGRSVDNAFHHHRIVGIVPDFNYNSMHEAVGPLMMIWRNNASYIANVKVNTTEIGGVIAHLDKTWSTWSPDAAFSWSLLSDSLDKLYDGEKRMGIIFLSFSSFAVLIAFMGLYGLASFMVEKRTREISIRKVLGATTANLLVMLTREFLILILLSLVIAVPLGWMGMNSWLENYSARIQITAYPFIISGMLAAILMMVTMGYHVMKLSHHNPSKTLNRE
jgi:putative ABC transport system permease protein